MSKEVGLKWYLHSIGLALSFSPVQYRVLSLCENCVADSQPDVDAVFANNYCLQIIETGFAEQFKPLTV
jgi:hypothetical protein